MIKDFFGLCPNLVFLAKISSLKNQEFQQCGVLVSFSYCQVEILSCFIVFITLFLVHCSSNLKFSSCCHAGISCFVDFIFGVLVSFSCHQANKLISCVLLISFLVFSCLLLLVKLVSWYLVFHHLQCLIVCKLQVFNHCYIIVGFLVFGCVFKSQFIMAKDHDVFMNIIIEDTKGIDLNVLVMVKMGLQVVVVGLDLQQVIVK